MTEENSTRKPLTFPDYETFGSEWREYMMRQKKEIAVQMASNLGKDNLNLRADNARLRSHAEAMAGAYDTETFTDMEKALKLATAAYRRDYPLTEQR